MAASDYPKGSILNPFTYSEYHAMAQANTWHGGWVTESSDDRTYYTQGGVQHNYMGNKQHPYSIEIFNEMVTNEMWIGGWVLHTDDSLRYYTASLTWYSPYNNDDLWGSEAYPVSSDIYVEMCNLSLWEGGWIESEDATYYVGYPTLDGGSSGDGCGCGCGCGCSGEGSGCDEGSGCGEGGCDGGSGSDDQITPGSRVVGSNEDGTITLMWDATPHFNFELHLYTTEENVYFSGIEGATSVMWDGRHTAVVNGSIKYTKYTKVHVNIMGEGVNEEGYTMTQTDKLISVSVTTVDM